MAVDVFDGDHHSPAKPVVMTLRLPRSRHEEAGLFGKFRRNPFLLKKFEQMTPSLRGKTEAKCPDRRLADPSLPEILPGALPGR